MKEIKCIFCDLPNIAKSEEHIVSESFGNRNYIMTKSTVCDCCNSKFSKFEKKALSNSIFLMERARHGIKSKKQKSAKGKIGDFEIEGDPYFENAKIFIRGLQANNMREFNPRTNTFKLLLPAFDKSEVATSKLLLKMGLESIFTSQNNLFKKYNFADLKIFLQGNNNINWPFVTSRQEAFIFKSIPKYQHKHDLSKLPCELKYSEEFENVLLFKFSYGGISMILNLVDRNLNCMQKILDFDSKAILYPEHFRNKIIGSS